MNMSTETTAVKSTDSERAVQVAPFGRVRPATHRRHRRPQERRHGSAAMRDPRRDLSMFEMRPVLRPRRIAVGEPLAPLLPPIVSEPLRRRPAVSQAPRATSIDAPALRRDAATEVPIARSAAVARERRGVRLTMRGYAAVLGLVVSGIAVCSALTVGHTDPAPSIRSTQVVARGGESIEGLAERSAQGRDVASVAESIRLANGLADGELPQAGEVLIVPGS